MLLLLMIAVPIALLSWLGVRLAQNEKAVIQQRFHKLLTSRLTDIDQQISEYLDELERSLQSLTDTEIFDPEILRDAVRSQPNVTTLFVMDPTGQLIHPSRGSLNRNESNFLVRANQVLIDKELFFAQRDLVESNIRNKLPLGKPPASLVPEAPQQDHVQMVVPVPQQRSSSRIQIATSSNTMINANAYNTNSGIYASSLPTTNGWISWFWGRGVHLIYWQRRSSGFLVGAEVDRSRLIANIIARLPETPTEYGNTSDAESLIRLVDSSSRTVYQWGRYAVDDQTESFCEIPVTNPLSSWRLKYFAPIHQLTAGAGRGIYLNLVTGLTIATLGLAALGSFAYREYSRDMREAEQRVSFVNQVSHELKTPLTNIRMYADLLDNDLDGLDDRISKVPRNRLDVIQSESQRLSRLIGNVLTFAGQKRKTLQLKKTDAVVDNIVYETLKRFRPSLEQAEIETVFEAGAGRTVSVDPDAVEQIVGNLINNVEKYAADGKQLRIVSRQTNDETTIEMQDNGNGVHPKMREKIFQPFSRASDDLNRAAGTGIGLSIARELARLHGGDLKLLDSDRGARFQLQLPNSNGTTT
jgi:signal transduction histidine kinase